MRANVFPSASSAPHLLGAAKKIRNVMPTFVRDVKVSVCDVSRDVVCDVMCRHDVRLFLPFHETHTLKNLETNNLIESKTLYTVNNRNCREYFYYVNLDFVVVVSRKQKKHYLMSKLDVK